MSSNNPEQQIPENNHNDTLLNHLEISVSESEKRNTNTLNLRDYYTVYLIETKVTDANFKSDSNAKLTTVWRRYTEFEQLRDYLSNTYPYIVLPPLPEKKVMFGWQKISNDTFDPNFIDRRRAGLENFLLRIAAHPFLCWDKHFIDFLRNDVIDSHSHQPIRQMSLMRLTTKTSDETFDGFTAYSGLLQNNLNNLLKARCRVAEKRYNVHKLHANYGRVFSEWSVIEREGSDGDGLQKTGHYLDSLASFIDAALEDEELLADQLKEYLFFAQSMQNVCKNHENLQMQLEQAEEAVNTKHEEKSRVMQGKGGGLIVRLFGAVDSEEVREGKLNALETQIDEAVENVNKSKQELSEFTLKALEDVERFQKQKDVDLRATLADYAGLQLKTARKGLQTWTQIRDCLQSL